MSNIIQEYYGDFNSVPMSVVGPQENGTTASRAYAVGEHFVKDGYFCTAIADIAQGATLTLNTNYREGNIARSIRPRYITKAVSSSNVTYATALTELQSAYSNMTTGERLHSRIRRGGNIYLPVSVGSGSGIYSEIIVDANNYVNLYYLKIMEAKYLSGKMYEELTDKSATNVGSTTTLVLEVLDSWDV